MTPDRRPADPHADRRRTTVLSVLFYGGLALLLAAIVSGTVFSVLPSGVARRVAHNSEGFAFALLLAAWIQLVSRRAGARPAWRGAVAAALACLLVGIWLFTGALPPAIKTLNETALALAIAIPYVTVRRPIGVIAPAASLGLLLLLVAGVTADPGGLVVVLAETMGILILLPIALDVVDRGILQPTAATSTALRWGWYAILVLEVGVVTALGVQHREGGGILAATLDYLGRAHESVIEVLLLQLFLAVGLGWTGRRPATANM